MRTFEADVVVVGCGVAGLSAAVAAREAGARVLVLERATREERGGNTRWTTAAIRMKSEAEVSDDFEERFAENAGYHLDPALVAETARDRAGWPAIVRALPLADPDVVAAFAASAPETIAWLRGHGVRFGPIGFYGVTPRSSPRISIAGGGLQLVEAMTEKAERMGVAFRFEATAEDLNLAADGSVEGVVVATRDTGRIGLLARAVVLACGGFEGNPEMVVRYIGPKGRYLRPVARGGYYNKGEGVRMGLAAGAAPGGDFAEYHAQPIDPRSGAPEPLVMLYPYGILVNREGRRFLDEAPGPVDASYEPIARRIADQADGIAFAILDARVLAIEGWQRCLRTDQPPERAASLAELAGRLGIDAEALGATVAAYNAACPAGAFDPYRLDGLATGGLSPRKSNYARPIAEPPFLAWPVISSNTFTFGGLKTDPDGRVLDRDGVPIRGLYAAGETAGLYFGRYPGATSVLRGAVFGRRAGMDAARRANAGT